MEIRHLNTFLQIAMLKSFTRAGQSLGYCQSNVSAQIQQMEKEIGAPLFNRINHKISLTQYGEELLPYAQSIVSMAECVENLMKTDRDMGGTIHVGIVQSLFDLLFEPAVTSYHKRFPNVIIDLTVDSTSMLKELLQDGKLDFACIIDDMLPLTQWKRYHSQLVPIVIVANADNTLCLKENIFLKDFENREFILMEETATYSQHFQHLMAEKDINFKSFLKLQSTQAACRLVEKNDFLTVLPRYSVLKSEKSGKVKILNVPEFCQAQYTQIILHPSRAITPQTDAFLKELTNCILKYIGI